jgi:CheY-like chemotaxis protein
VTPLSVLFVQSASDDRDVYTEYLREHGYSVTIAASTDEALSHVPSVDALITGLTVPGPVNSANLIRRIRGNFGNLPIVVITSSPSNEAIEEAEKAGADLVLRKPSPDLLLRAIEAAMDATQEAQEEAVRRKG